MIGFASTAELDATAGRKLTGLGKEIVLENPPDGIGLLDATADSELKETELENPSDLMGMLVTTAESGLTGAGKGKEPELESPTERFVTEISFGGVGRDWSAGAGAAVEFFDSPFPASNIMA